MVRRADAIDWPVTTIASRAIADSLITMRSPVVPTDVVTVVMRYPISSSCKVTSVPGTPSRVKRPSGLLTVD